VLFIENEENNLSFYEIKIDGAHTAEVSKLGLIDF